MTVFIQLTGVGTDSGPYSLFYDANPTPFVVGVSRATLVTGANYTIPDGSSSITVRSTGICPDVITLPIISPTTTTTTTTGIPCYTYTLSTTAPTFAFDYNFIDCAGEYTASSLSGEGNTVDICARVGTVTISSGDGNSVMGSTCSAPPTTTTSTTTTTTTSIPYWYILTGCADALTYYAGPFTGPQAYSTGERVMGATLVYYVVTTTTTTNPGPVLSGISSTGDFGCPP